MSKVIALDPGATHIGWAVVESVQRVFPQDESLYKVLDYGCLELPKRDKKRGFNEQMDESTRIAYSHFRETVYQYYPDYAAWEMVPAFGAMSERERVTACLTAFKIATWVLPVRGTMAWTPRGMKKAFTGDSKATKGQIRDRVFEVFPDLLDVENMPPDAYDAIAIAVVSIESGKWTTHKTPL